MHTRRACSVRSVGYKTVIKFAYFVMEKLWNIKVQKACEPCSKKANPNNSKYNFTFSTLTSRDKELVIISCPNAMQCYKVTKNNRVGGGRGDTLFAT